MKLQPITSNVPCTSAYLADKRNYCFSNHPRWLGLSQSTQPSNSSYPFGIVLDNESGSGISVLIKSVDLVRHSIMVAFVGEHGAEVGPCLKEVIRLFVNDWGFDRAGTYLFSGDPLGELLTECGFTRVATFREHAWLDGEFRDVDWLMWRRSMSADVDTSTQQC